MRRKLNQLDAAGELRDLGAPPGNRLEALSGQPVRPQNSVLLRFHFNRRAGAPTKTVLEHGQEVQRPIRLKWKWN